MVADWTAQLDLDNLVPYTHPSAAWSGRHSNLALCWERPAEMGLQRLQSLARLGRHPVTARLLSWQVFEDGRALPLALAARNYRPDIVTEVDAGPDLELTVTAAWPVRNTLAVRFEVRNLAQAARRLTLAFDYPGQDTPPDWQGVYPLGESDGFRHLQPGICVSLDDEAPGCWSTLFIHQEHGHNIGWVRDYVAGMPQGTLELVCLTDLHPRELVIPPGGSHACIPGPGVWRQPRPGAGRLSGRAGCDGPAVDASRRDTRTVRRSCAARLHPRRSTPKIRLTCDCMPMP